MAVSIAFRMGQIKTALKANQRQLSELLGISRNTASRWSLGRDASPMADSLTSLLYEVSRAPYAPAGDALARWKQQQEERINGSSERQQPGGPLGPRD